MEQYEYISTIGEGAYAQCWRCRERATGKHVAVKGFKQAHEDAEIMRLALREVRILKSISHANCVHLLEAFKSKSGRVYLVFEFADKSLFGELQRNPSGLPSHTAKLVLWQMVHALVYLHNAKIVHRDIKPANVLMTNEGVVKLCDFGFARLVTCGLREAQQLSTYVVTRWYRAPEVLVSDVYGPAADVWSLGCTFAELATGRPLFPGRSTADQLWLIMRCLGPLGPQQAGRMARDARLASVAQPPPLYKTLRQRLPEIDMPLFHLIQACLHVDPRQRPTAAELLQMPYFWEVPRLIANTPLAKLHPQSPAPAPSTPVRALEQQASNRPAGARPDDEAAAATSSTAAPAAAVPAPAPQPAAAAAVPAPAPAAAAAGPRSPSGLMRPAAPVTAAAAAAAQRQQQQDKKHRHSAASGYDSSAPPAAAAPCDAEPDGPLATTRSSSASSATAPGHVAEPAGAAKQCADALEAVTAAAKAAPARAAPLPAAFSTTAGRLLEAASAAAAAAYHSAAAMRDGSDAATDSEEEDGAGLVSPLDGAQPQGSQPRTPTSPDPLMPPAGGGVFGAGIGARRASGISHQTLPGHLEGAAARPHHAPIGAAATILGIRQAQVTPRVARNSYAGGAPPPVAAWPQQYAGRATLSHLPAGSAATAHPAFAGHSLRVLNTNSSAAFHHQAAVTRASQSHTSAVAPGILGGAGPLSGDGTGHSEHSASSQLLPARQITGTHSFLLEGASGLYSNGSGMPLASLPEVPTPTGAPDAYGTHDARLPHRRALLSNGVYPMPRTTEYDSGPLTAVPFGAGPLSGSGRVSLTGGSSSRLLGAGITVGSVTSPGSVHSGGAGSPVRRGASSRVMPLPMHGGVGQRASTSTGIAAAAPPVDQQQHSHWHHMRNPSTPNMDIDGALHGSHAAAAPPATSGVLNPPVNRTASRNSMRAAGPSRLRGTAPGGLDIADALSNGSASGQLPAAPLSFVGTPHGDAGRWDGTRRIPSDILAGAPVWHVQAAASAGSSYTSGDAAAVRMPPGFVPRSGSGSSSAQQQQHGATSQWCTHAVTPSSPISGIALPGMSSGGSGSSAGAVLPGSRRSSTLLSPPSMTQHPAIAEVAEEWSSATDVGMHGAGAMTSEEGSSKDGRSRGRNSSLQKIVKGGLKALKKALGSSSKPAAN